MAETKKVEFSKMAKKKRFIYLLNKLQKGEKLNPSEIKELERAEKEPNSPGIVELLEEVAKGFGVGHRTVQRWKKDGMPVNPEGTYNLVHIQRWRNDKNSKITGKKDKAYYERERLRIKVKKEMIELQKIQGSLVPMEEVKKGRIDRILMVKRIMMALPKDVAGILAMMNEPRDIEVYLTDKMIEICNIFAGEYATKTN